MTSFYLKEDRLMVVEVLPLPFYFRMEVDEESWNRISWNLLISNTKAGLSICRGRWFWNNVLFGYSVDGGEVKVIDLMTVKRYLADTGCLSMMKILPNGHLTHSLRRVSPFVTLDILLGSYVKPSLVEMFNDCRSAYSDFPFVGEDVEPFLGLKNKSWRKERPYHGYFCVHILDL